MFIASILNTDPEKVSAWGKLIRDIGVPILMLCAMSFAMYKGGLWIGEKILLPTLEKNEALVDSQTKSNEALLTNLNMITENIRQQAEANKTNTESITKISSDIAAIRNATETSAANAPKFFTEQQAQSEILRKLLDKDPIP